MGDDTGVGSGSGSTAVVTSPKDGSDESHGMSTQFASLGTSSVIHRSGDAEVAENSVEDKPELLYAIEFSVAPARKGDKTIRLLAEVNDSRRSIHMIMAIYRCDKTWVGISSA